MSNTDDNDIENTARLVEEGRMKAVKILRDCANVESDQEAMDKVFAAKVTAINLLAQILFNEVNINKATTDDDEAIKNSVVLLKYELDLIYKNVGKAEVHRPRNKHN